MFQFIETEASLHRQPIRTVSRQALLKCFPKDKQSKTVKPFIGSELDWLQMVIITNERSVPDFQ
jgi:hypothetical protein